MSVVAHHEGADELGRNAVEDGLELHRPAGLVRPRRPGREAKDEHKRENGEKPFAAQQCPRPEHGGIPGANAIRIS
jgi:hypothetical protein